MGDMGEEPVNNGSGIERKESNVPVTFDDKMKKPQLYALHKEWRKFKQFFKTQPEALVEPFDWAGNTALHVVTRSNNPQLLRDLLGLIKDKDQRGNALKIKNAHGNTVLHHVILCSEVEMLDVLVGYKDLTPRRPKEIGEKMGKEERELLEIRNVLGETLVYRAARCGRIHMLVHLRRYYLHDHDLLTHFPKLVTHKCNICSEQGSQSSENQEKSILYLAIAGQYMDVAMWLISEVPGIEELADGTCLQLLSQMPSFFRSRHQLRTVEKLIYNCTLFPHLGRV